jgi:hypothetical protein
LRPADFAQSAQRLHGSMVFKVLALRFLMAFSCFPFQFPSQFSLSFGIDFGKLLLLILGVVFETLAANWLPKWSPKSMLKTVSKKNRFLEPENF